MDLYFLMIVAINLLLLLVTWGLINGGNALGYRQKQAFSFLILLTALIAVDEFLSLLVNGLPGMRTVNLLINAAGFGMAPLLPVAISCAMGDDQKHNTWLWFLIGINTICVFSGYIFTVNRSNFYARSDLFFIFPLTYLASIVALAVNTIRFSRKHQNKNVFNMILIVLFMMASTMIQFFRPNIHVTWLCMSIAILLHYVYYCDFIQQVDSLTGLLNRHSFDRQVEHRTRRLDGIVIFDMDGFKNINDTYGHMIGDNYLRFFGETLLKVYARAGSCYRLGGDEFCVLLRRGQGKMADALEANMVQELKKVDLSGGMIRFSAGYAPVDRKKGLKKAVRQADEEMYISKAGKSR